MSKLALALDPTGYRKHPLHGDDRVWAESNCDADVWIELLHALGFEPLAALPFTLTIDFEGDQWTFFQLPHADLRDLYALDVRELTVWRPVVAHVEEQMALGRPVLLDVDSWHLPDTAGTAYHRDHVKTTLAVAEIDVPTRWLGYFHNQGYYHLDGEDFAALFHQGAPAEPWLMPPGVRIVKLQPGPALRGADLAQASRRLLRKHLERLPKSNPFPRFRERFEADLRWLAGEPPDAFHRYSFVTLRQFGAGYELAAAYLRWLGPFTALPVEAPAAALHDLATGAKTLQFLLARALARKKSLDLSPLDRLAEGWQAAMAQLQATFLGGGR
jgi:hypothetical protein